jgi:hypothetical protein
MQAVTQSTSQWVNHSRLRMFCPGHGRVTGDGFFGFVFGFTSPQFSTFSLIRFQGFYTPYSEPQLLHGK